VNVAPEATRIVVLATIIVPMALICCACGDQRPSDFSRGTSTTTDSSGIEVVTSSAPAWKPGEEWRLSAVPLLTLGSLGGGERKDDFYGTIFAFRLADSLLAVADGSNVVKYYDLHGNFLASAGGSGMGPREFERINNVVRLGTDTLVLSSPPNKISYIEGVGEFADEFRPDSLGIFLTVFGNGSIVGFRRGPPVVALRRPNRGELPPQVTDSMHYGLADREGNNVRDFITLGFRQRYSSSMAALIFGSTGFVGTFENQLFHAHGSAPEIRVYDSAGAIRRIFRLGILPVSVSEDDRASYADARLRNTGTLPDLAVSELRKQLVDPHGAAAAHPFFNDMLVGRRGDVWLREYLIRDGFPTAGQLPDSNQRRWRVVGSDGVWLGDVFIPPYFTIREIGSDYVLGIVTHPDSVPLVRVYALEKPFVSR
jgi:hypothetical protein